MLKNITIGILLLALIVGGTLWYRHYQNIMNAEPTKTLVAPETPTKTGHWHGDEWHAEPHPEHQPEPSTDPGPAAEPVEQPPSVETKTRKRPLSWRDLDGDIPPADAPRPFRHLTFDELHGDIDEDTLSDENWLHYINEFFFRMPKETRDNFRKNRAEQKEARAFFKWYEETFPE